MAAARLSFCWRSVSLYKPNYRVIWNHTLGVYQVCSELTKRMTQSFALTLSGRSELNKKT
ncbi:hypothetical protein FYK26_07540 [Escherichia albertii]|nr:hypothetical protein FYK30_07545 [Escherichia albertii]QSZ88791.1 hypothetical protein FYK29_07550 [Escherichia albertii]QSZ93178.1 hypothetical protein FYK28_07560 [Escherichia albertii]QSZ97945.1 hypothetical protein FYK27_09685 [Escherichia albertii]QTA01962.1 hypothetical protein FYK26_07540 [Escherichia albertii]